MNLGITNTVLLVAGLIVIIFIGIFIGKKIPRSLKQDKFTKQWKDLQTHCKDKTTWAKAVTEADKLLDCALKKRKFGGKSMGERMVSAQRKFTDNDGVWFAHNLCKKIVADESLKLKEADVKSALIGFRQALKDLGALQNGEQQNG